MQFRTSLLQTLCYKHYVTDTMLQTLCYRYYVADTLAITYLPSTSFTAAALLKQLTCVKKESTENNIYVTHFVPIALETLGPGSKALLFSRELGHRLSRSTEDLRESAFFFHRLLARIQRYTSTACALTAHLKTTHLIT